MRHTLCLLLAIPLLAFAQLDDNTITVTASRPNAVQPDQVVIGISVDMPVNATLDDVLGALKDTGVTAANLTYVDSVGISPIAVPGGVLKTNVPPVEWGFTLPVPLGNVNSTLAALASIQQSLANGAATAVSYSLQGTQISPALKAANPCPYTALLSDAQKQAQTFAQTAGGSAGAIVAISDQPAIAAPSVIVPAQRSGDFSFVLGTGSSVLTSFLVGVPPYYTPVSPPPTCSLTVQFKLLR